MATLDDIDLDLVKTAIRSYWSYTCDTNPVPLWDHFGGAQKGIAEELRQRLVDILNNDHKPDEPLEFKDIPDSRGKQLTWYIPTINMQLVLQYCGCALAPAMHAKLIPDTVYSYPGLDQNFKLLPLQTAWASFQEETERRQSPEGIEMLQLDLSRAFASVNRKSFLELAREVDRGGAASTVLSKILPLFGDKGLPLINDSIMALGNAYLAKVDRIIAKHNIPFIRFMDDYRLFCKTGTAKAVFEDVKKAIEGKKEGGEAGDEDGTKKRPTEFSINEEKLRIVNCLQTPQTEAADIYGGSSPAIEEGGASQIHDTIKRVIEDSRLCFNVRIGRAVLGAIRRQRSEEAKAKSPKRHGGSTRRAISRSRSATATLDRLLQREFELRDLFLKNIGDREWLKTNSWRTVWLLYVFAGLFTTKTYRDEELKAVEALTSSSDPCVKAWAVRLTKNAEKYDKDLFELQDLSYPEQGRYNDWSQ